MSEGDDATPMLDQRPYLLRALNDWIVDSGFTPHVLVDATGDGVCVPLSAISDGRVVLNISPTAVRYLDISADAATPGSAAAEEAVSDVPGTLRQDGPDDDAPPPRGRPGLRVVK